MVKPFASLVAGLVAAVAVALSAGAQEGRDKLRDDRCRVTAEGRLVCDPVEREKLGPEQKVREFFASSGVDGALRSTRLFSGPDTYPPEEFRGYGMIAFPSRASSYDRDRHLMICAAFVASLPPSERVPTPTADQFVTVWPVESDDLAAEISRLPLDETCPAAVDHYSQEAAIRAIAAASRSGFKDDGLGPYLLAWSPTDRIGRPDAFVLALDLSNVVAYDQALALMREWNRDIETDFEILSQGFTLDRLRVSIRRWADNYGEGLLKLLGGA